MSNIASNKKLATNTLLLYFRMVFLMLVTLYTSRVTLEVLGVEDFGIYNIVSGVVVLFSFLSRSLNSACNRYFSIAVATDDVNEIQKNFSTALVAHFYLMVIVVIILESVGLWFINEKLNVPYERSQAVSIIYQIAVLSVCFNIIRTPYNASIIAHENMGFYAYTSLVEGILKLLIAWLLLIVSADHLIVYSLLMALIILAINIWYLIYCNSKFKGNRFVLKSDTTKMKEMLSFSGWNLFAGIADLGWQQGTNMILNVFYGVTLNAAMGITNQVRNAVFSFVANLQTASNPQIIKSYSLADYNRFYTLIYAISKYSFYLMLLFTIPLLLNIDYVMDLWLKNVPEYAISFTSLILVFSLFDTLIGPLWMANQANGDVKKYSIIVSCILLLNLPATYVLFYFKCVPESMLYARIVILLLSLLFQLFYTRLKVSLSLRRYFKDVLSPIILVTVISVSITYVSSFLLDGFVKLVVSSLLSTIILCCTIYIVGIGANERTILKKYLVQIIQKLR